MGWALPAAHPDIIVKVLPGAYGTVPQGIADNANLAELRSRRDPARPVAKERCAAAFSDARAVRDCLTRDTCAFHRRIAVQTVTKWKRNLRYNTVCARRIFLSAICHTTIF